MPAITHSPQTRPRAAAACYQAQPASWGIAAVRRQPRQLIRALTRHSRRLHLPRRAGYRLEPMPRMRWYT